jgi:hypothetical protein
MNLEIIFLGFFSNFKLLKDTTGGGQISPKFFFNKFGDIGTFGALGTEIIVFDPVGKTRGFNNSFK